MHLSIEFDTEADGRYIAEIPELPGALAYGSTQSEAKSRVEALALRILADQIDQTGLDIHSISFQAA